MSTTYVTGNATKDARSMTTKTGKTVTTLSIADNKTVNGKEVTKYFTIKLWGKLAYQSKDVKKGDIVSVVGDIGVNTYDKKDGTKGYDLEVNARQFNFIGKTQFDSEIPF